MKPVDRSEIIDFVTYDEQRDEIRKKIMEIKKPRRIHVSENFTFLFENTETIRYQIQEMLRIEQIVKEADIQHEIKTYNELLGATGELGGTLMIEIPNPAERDVKLRQWVGLMDHVYMTFTDGTKSKAEYDKRQVGEERLSSVQYVKFHVGERKLKGMKVEFPGAEVEMEFSSEQLDALTADLH